MRPDYMARYPLIGVTAAAVLIFQLPPQAAATTDLKVASPAPAEAAPAPAPSAESVAKPGEATAEVQPEAAKPKPLPPSLVARINLSSQTMTVLAGDKTIHSWKVSTGARGYATPPGTFKPGWMSKMWYSRQYDNAPMPHSVFFNGGIAVHATTSTGLLGRPASHGCVRLSPANAARFYQLVSKHGMGMTRIVVHGAQPFARTDRIARNNGNRGNRNANNRNANNRNANIRTTRRGGAYGSDSYRIVAQAPRYSVARSPAPYRTRY